MLYKLFGARGSRSHARDPAATPRCQRPTVGTRGSRSQARNPAAAPLRQWPLAGTRGSRANPAIPLQRPSVYVACRMRPWDMPHWVPSHVVGRGLPGTWPLVALQTVRDSRVTDPSPQSRCKAPTSTATGRNSRFTESCCNAPPPVATGRDSRVTEPSPQRPSVYLACRTRPWDVPCWVPSHVVGRGCRVPIHVIGPGVLHASVGCAALGT